MKLLYHGQGFGCTNTADPIALITRALTKQVNSIAVFLTAYVMLAMFETRIHGLQVLACSQPGGLTDGGKGNATFLNQQGTMPVLHNKQRVFSTSGSVSR